MKYIMKAGTLYKQGEALAQIKGSLTGAEKKVFSMNGALLLQTDIRIIKSPGSEAGNIRFRQYIMRDAKGEKYAVANPDYAKEANPAVVGWPICRMPKVDHAQILMGGVMYRLIMRNSQNYWMEKCAGERVIQIFHRGLIGGWDMETIGGFRPETICGIFIFCRYIERENEFLIV